MAKRFTNFVAVKLTDEQLAHLRTRARREERSVAWVLRQLVVADQSTAQSRTNR